MSKYTVRDINAKPGADPIVLEADHVEHNEQTGRITFFDDDNAIVGQFVNVTFFKQPNAA